MVSATSDLPRFETPWQEDTIINVYSTTKTMSFLTALMLADRGELDFDAPVARYWPEFAANGKEDVRVWHLMNHTAGLSSMDLVTGVPQTFGLGFGIVPESVPLSPNKNTCYWGGWGGSGGTEDAGLAAQYQATHRQTGSSNANAFGSRLMPPTGL